MYLTAQLTSLENMKMMIQNMRFLPRPDKNPQRHQFKKPFMQGKMVTEVSIGVFW